MCGITGYWGLSNKQLLVDMCNTMEHRGPDDAGYYHGNNIGLGMRRLAIIDLKTGNQPIANEAKDVWIVFNGEIYNYQSLRADLQKKGHIFTTTSDTETIVHLYEEQGLDFVNFLQGMFSIALWDDTTKCLILARDRIGEKPLYYSIQGSKLFFGSEIKTILQAINSRSVHHQAICDYLATGYVTAPRTFYNEIEKLPPGGMLICDESGIHLRQYWQLPKPTRHDSTSFKDAKIKLSKTLKETIGLCLKSDVEVGAFLSGGIDSSVIVALIRQHNAHVQTFSVGYEGEAEGFNELHYAKQVAKHLGTEHHELILGPQSSMELLPKIIWHYDEPHGEPTSVLVYLLCEFTSKRVKVAVGGTGGDEIFFGYPKHAGIRLHQYYHLIPKILRKQLIEKIIAKWPESTKGSRFAKRAKRFISGADLPPEEAYISWVSLLHKDIHNKLLSQNTISEATDPTGEEFLRNYLTGSTSDCLLDNIARLDINGYLPEYQLTYMDRMSMAHSLEVRSPLCDYKLIEYVTSLPTSYRLKGTRSKHILKEVAKQWLPHNIVERKKVGFDSPIGQWFKTELRPFLEKFLSKDQIVKSGLLNPAGVQTVIKDHLSGKKDYSLQLWSIIALEVWYRMYIEGQIKHGKNVNLADLRGVSR
jgi:asparagine synthase (glutamine-hydrolysing)